MPYDAYDDPELFKAALKMFHTYYKRCLIFALERGAKIIFESWYNCSLSAGWSPAVWREYFMPCIIEDAAILIATELISIFMTMVKLCLFWMISSKLKWIYYPHSAQRNPAVMWMQ
jgi:hypothetical protein